MDAAASQQQEDAVQKKLAGIRARTDLALKPMKHLKDTFTDFDGQEKPLRIRYYQTQGIFHLLLMKRFLLGDDTGLGKTLETLGALCAIWERDPDRKVVILTTKSAAKQWAREFAKFTTGVKVIVGSGTPIERATARYQYVKSTGPTVFVSGYRAIVQDFSHVQNWKGYILVADECFDYHTPVVLADGTTELIGKIVSQRLPVQVLAWNPDTGVVEPRQVTNWFRKPLEAGRRKDLLRLTFRYSDNVRVTGSHEFYRPDQSKTPASRLKVGDEVFHYSGGLPSEAQWQVVLGSLLGDASISMPDRHLKGICFSQCSRQEGLLQFKRNVLEPLGVSETDRYANGGFPKKDGTPKEQVRFRLNGNAAVSSFLEQCRIRRAKKKRVTTEWLDRIGPLGLAIWYADDGTLNSHPCEDGSCSRTISFCTHGFSWEEQETLVGWLRWKWGIQAEIRTETKRTGRENGTRKSYPYLHLDQEATARFFQTVPGSIPGVLYKFPPGMLPVDVSALDLRPRQGLVRDRLVSRSRWTPGKNHKYVYDIEVEGNHNYFANGTLVSNCTAFKNPKTQVHQVCRHLSDQADRVWALTATLIKNNLMEGHGIFSVVKPGLFGTQNNFMLYYCIVRMQRIPKSKRQIPIIVGYMPEKIKEFRGEIAPFFLGRPKHEVATELPALVQQTVEVELTREQEDKYDEALSGLLTLGNDVKETDKLTQVTYCQEVCDHLGLLNTPGDSGKLDTLIDLLTQGDFADEKVIVFSRFRKMIDILMPVFATNKIKAVRVTGSENETDRDNAMKAFQDPNDETRVCCITMAGSESINLQAAKAIIFFDTPWSAGDYIQILGRMIRIGSEHDRCHAVHLVGKLKRHKQSIDQRIMVVQAKKMNLVEAVIGKRIKGVDDTAVISVDNDISDLFEGLKADAKVTAS